MWDEFVSTVITNGIFATLFVGLLVYELKDYRKRESKCQKTIESLSNKINTIDEIKQDVIEIKERITNLPPKPKRRKNETDKVI